MRDSLKFLNFYEIVGFFKIRMQVQKELHLIVFTCMDFELFAQPEYPCVRSLLTQMKRAAILGDLCEGLFFSNVDQMLAIIDHLPPRLALVKEFLYCYVSGKILIFQYRLIIVRLS